MLFLIGLMLFTACTAETPPIDKPGPDPDPEETSVTAPDIFRAATEGYSCFRIPAVSRTKKNTLLAFAEGRKRNCKDEGDIDLVLRRSVDNGKTWSPLIMVWDDGGNTCGNPSPVVDPETGRIHLLMTWNLGEDNIGGPSMPAPAPTLAGCSTAGPTMTASPGHVRRRSPPR